MSVPARACEPNLTLEYRQFKVPTTFRDLSPFFLHVWHNTKDTEYESKGDTRYEQLL